MPLKILEEDNVGKPVIICDHCGERIANVKDGNYQWRFEEGGGKATTIYFTHKNCCHPFEKLNPGHWDAMDLDSLFVYLADSLKLDWKSAKTRASFLNRLGP
jgi:hypothetical protein